MDVEDLLAEWEAGGTTGLRPSRAQALRSDLMEHTGMWFPHRRSELESNMERMKGQITLWLRKAVEEPE